MRLRWGAALCVDDRICCLCDFYIYNDLHWLCAGA